MALWIFGFHAGSFFPGSAVFDNAVFRGGFAAVEAFFFLSGFVLFYVHGQEMLRPTRAAILDFIRLRLARIYPLHLFVTVLYIAYVGGLFLTQTPLPPERYSLAALFAQISLTQSWLGYEMTWNIPAWSISAEWAAYIAFPVLVFVLGRSRPITYLAAAMALFAWIHLALGAGTPLQRVAASFPLGMAVCRFPAIVRLARSITTPLLTHPAIMWLGAASYSIYMLHFIVLTTVRKVLPGEAAPDVGPILGLAVTLAASWATYRWIETPYRRWARAL